MQSMWRHLQGGWLVVVVPVLLLGGCKQAAKEVSKEAVQAAPSGIEASLKSLSDSKNQQQLEELASMPAVQHLAEGMGRGIGEGMVAGVTGTAGTSPPQTLPATRPTVQGQETDVAGSAGGGATTQPAEADLNKAAAAIARSAVQEAMKAGLGPEAQGMARQMATQSGGATMRGVAEGAREDLGPAVNQVIREQLGPALAASMREELGPALGQVLREQVAPGMRQVMHDAVHGAVEGAGKPSRPVVGEATAREVSKGAALGIGDAMVEMGVADPAREINGNITKVMWVAVGLLAVGGLVMIGLIVAVFVLALVVWRSRGADVRPTGGR
ncbi:MAG: hypothetical protein ACM359_18650 [Bacillota bacterium]